MSFCGSRDVILWVYSCHFVGLEGHFAGLHMSFCGCRDVILLVRRCHFVGLEMSF